MPSGGNLGNPEGNQTAWQGPVVTDTEYDVSKITNPIKHLFFVERIDLFVYLNNYLVMGKIF